VANMETCDRGVIEAREALHNGNDPPDPDQG